MYHLPNGLRSPSAEVFPWSKKRFQPQRLDCRSNPVQKSPMGQCRDLRTGPFQNPDYLRWTGALSLALRLESHQVLDHAWASCVTTSAAKRNCANYETTYFRRPADFSGIVSSEGDRWDDMSIVRDIRLRSFFWGGACNTRKTYRDVINDIGRKHREACRQKLWL